MASDHEFGLLKFAQVLTYNPYMALHQGLTQTQSGEMLLAFLINPSGTGMKTVQPYRLKN
jgi:hypothetical protein